VLYGYVIVLIVLFVKMWNVSVINICCWETNMNNEYTVQVLYTYTLPCLAIFKSNKITVFVEQSVSEIYDCNRDLWL